MKQLMFIVAIAALLAACGEKPQTIGNAKQDAPAYTGTGKGFANKDWKQGDKASWESQLKARGLNSQNDYAKAN
jgi:major membrane immunogen (membrane-anchored lipoprotein)